MSTDNQHRSSSLKAYPALDAYDGIAHVAVSAYAVSSTYLLHSLNSLDFVVVLLAIDRAQLTLLEAQFQSLRTLLGRMLQVSALRQSLLRVENLAATD